MQELRDSTNYPTFRSVANVMYYLWMFLALCAAIGTVIALFRSEGQGQVTALIVGTLATLFFVIIARLGKEIALMLADLSDAAVFSAQQAKK